jgi:hypothetical protein
MALGWYVALEREIPGVDGTAVGGKALIHAQRQLDDLARQLGLPPVTGFLSVIPEQVAGFLEREGLDPEAYPIPEEEWYAPGEGLRTVQGLLGHLRSAPQVVHNGGRVLQELLAVERILAAAEREKVPFHLASELPSGAD